MCHWYWSGESIIFIRNMAQREIFGYPIIINAQKELWMDNRYRKTSEYPEQKGKKFDIENYGCFSEKYNL